MQLANQHVYEHAVYSLWAVYYQCTSKYMVKYDTRLTN